MPGLRIHHPTLAGCTLLVSHPGDPATGRRPKDYHIHLDANGDAIVSETVWRRLQEARGSGLSPHEFLVLNEVLDPPTLVVGPPGGPDGTKARTYRQRPDGSIVDDELETVLQKFAPKGVKPRITTHEVKKHA